MQLQTCLYVVQMNILRYAEDWCKPICVFCPVTFEFFNVFSSFLMWKIDFSSFSDFWMFFIFV